MSFLSPAPPPFELEEWKRKPHLERIKPLVQDWGENGFGSPSFVYLLYALKLVVYAGGALLAISTTPGLGGIGSFGDWWTQPIVLEKFAGWTLLWERLGAGAGSMPLSFRSMPPIGGPLYWLRPGAVRLPPWPDRGPVTRGAPRGGVGGALFAGGLPARVCLRPRPPPGNLRAEARGRAVSRQPVDRRLAVRLHLHLVGRRLLEAEPSLSLRSLGDGQQRAAGRAEVFATSG